MSREIDQRVVELQFDNANFERNAKESLSTLDKLKESLGFKRAGEGLRELERKIAKFTMQPVVNAVQHVRAEFTLLDNLTWNFFSRISRQILDIGKQITIEFTIDPIKTGFQEYETQINSVQTILANTQSKGSTLEDVNRALDKLNKYADLTIYNFTEMTRNIGTFTAAGIELEDATNAIQGISNLAAVSGSTAQQASTAMYQLSQALSSGTLKLQDWNSVVNAGMGGEVFQNALKQTAREYGIAVDSIIEKAGTFRESLKEGWITSEVLTTTLKKMTVSGADEYLAKLTGISLEHISAMHEEAAASADMEKSFRDLAKELAATGKVTEDQAYQLLNMSTTAQDAATKVKTFTQLMDTLKEAAQSGWTQTWKLIIGDFGEAKELFTYLSDTFSGLISESADARNAIVADALGSNWEKLTNTLTEAGVSIDAFKEKLITNARDSGIAIDDWIAADGSFEQTLSRGWLKDTAITKAFEDMTAGINTGTKSLEEYEAVVKEVVQGKYNNGIAERSKALAEAGWEIAEVQPLVNKAWDGTSLHLERLSKAELNQLNLTDEQIEAYKRLAEESKDPNSALKQMISDMSMPSGRELLVDSLKNTLSGILSITNSIRTAFNKTFKPSSSPIKKFLKTINDLSKKFVNVKKYTGQLTKTFSGLFSVLGIIGDIISGTLSFAFKTLNETLNIDAKSVLDFTANIGDTITAFRQWMKDTNAVQNSLAKFKTNIMSVVERVKEFIAGFAESDFVVTGITKIQNAFDSLKDGAGLDLESLKNSFTSLIQRIKNGGKVDLSGVSESMSTVSDDVNAELAEIDLSFSGFIAYMQAEVPRKFKSAFSGIAGALENFKTELGYWIGAIQETFAGLNWGVVLSLFNAGFLLALTSNITKKLDKLVSKLDPVRSIMDSVRKSIDQFANVLKAAALKQKAEALLEIAAAVGILALAMTLLATIKNEDLKAAAINLTIALAAIGAMAAVAALINKSSGSLTGALFSLLGLSVSIAIVANMITTLSSKLEEFGVTAEEFAKSAVMVGSVMLALAVSVAIMGTEIHSNGFTITQNLKGVGLYMIGFAAGLLVFAQAMNRLAAVKDVMNPGAAVQMVGLMGAMVLMLKLLSGEANVNAAKAGLGLLAVSAAMLILFTLMHKLPDLTTTKGWTKSLLSIVAITGVMFIILKALGGPISEHAAKAGLGVMGFASALTLLPVAIKLLGSIKKGELQKGLVAVTVIGGVFTGLIAVTKFAGEFAAKAGVTLLAAAGAMLAMTAVVAALGYLPQDKVKQALWAITVIGGIFAAIEGLSHFAKDAMKSIIAIGSVFTAFAAALAVLSSDMVDSDKMLIAAGSFSILMAAFTAMYTVIANTRSIRKSAAGGIAGITGIAIAMGTIIGILIKMTEDAHDFKMLGTAIAGISGLMLTLAATLRIISKVTPLAAEALTDLGALTLAVAGISLLVIGIAWIEKECDVHASIETIGSISLLLTSLAGAMVLISWGTALAGGAAGISAGLAGFLLFLTGMAGLLAVFGSIEAIVQEAGGFSVFEAGIETFGLIGEALGTMISSFGEGLVSGLPTIGTTLSEFMTNVQTFLGGLGDFNDASVNNVISLVNILSQLFAGDFQIKDAEENSEMYARLAANMTELMPALVEFANNCKDLNTEGLDAGTKAIEALVAASVMIPEEGGWLDQIFGTGNWTTFGTGLANLGTGIKDFADACKDIDEEGLEKGCDATVDLATASNNIPNSGGALAIWVGDNNWTTMRTGLVEYGLSLAAFSAAVKGVDKGAVEQGAWATNALATAADGIPNSGGKLADWLGDNNWVTFKEGLGSYGIALYQFSTYSEKIDYSAIITGVLSTEKLIEVYDDVSALNSPMGNKNVWAVLYQGLGEYGKNLKWFSEDIAEVDEDQLLKVFSATRNLADSITKLKEAKLDSTSDINWDNVSANLTEFKMILAGDVGQLAYTVNEQTKNGILAIKTYMHEIKEAFAAITSISESDVTAYKERIDLLLNTVINARNVANTIPQGVLLENFKNVGKDMFDGIAAGIEEDSVIKSVAKSVADSILTNFRDALGIPTNTESVTSTGSFKMKAYGKAMIDGFVDGVDTNTDVGAHAMQRFAQAMLVAFSTAMQTDNNYNMGKTAAEDYTSGMATVVKSVAKSGGMSGEVEGVLTGNGEVNKTANESGLDAVQKWFDGVMTGIGEKTQPIKDKIVGWFSGSGEGGSPFDGLLEKFGVDTNSLTSEIQKTMSTVTSDFTDGITDDFGFDDRLQEAKDKYNEFFQSYKEGKINQVEYDHQYTTLLGQYTDKQVDLVTYAQEEMKTHIEDTFNNVNSNFEKQVSDIQQKMDELAGSVTKPMVEAFSVKTNKDVYDEKMQGYQDRIGELTAKKEDLIAQYGEEHMWVKQAERDIESATNKMNEYKRTYEESTQENYDKQMAKYAANLEKLEKRRARSVKQYGEESNAVRQLDRQIQKINTEMEKYQKTHKVINDEDIARVDYADTFRKETIALANYNSTVQKLQERKVDDSILQMLAGETDIKKAAGIADYLNSLSDAELKAISDQYSIYQAAGKDLAQTFYGPEMKNAALDYTNDIINTMNTLPASAKSIGINMVAGLTSGFSAETEASLGQFGISGQSITDELKRIYDIHSPSRVMREEIGYNLADGLMQGFIDRLRMWTIGLNAKVMSDLGITADGTMIDVESFNSVLDGLTAAIQNRLNTQPTITPVLDLTQFDAGIALMQTKISMQTPTYLVNSAMTVNSSDASVVAAINSLGTTLSNKLDSINPNTAISTLDTNVNTNITNLNTAISGMSIVLDTGMLVGEISSDLGMASTMKGRGT